MSGSGCRFRTAGSSWTDPGSTALKRHWIDIYRALCSPPRTSETHKNIESAQISRKTTSCDVVTLLKHGRLRYWQVITIDSWSSCKLGPDGGRVVFLLIKVRSVVVWLLGGVVRIVFCASLFCLKTMTTCDITLTQLAVFTIDKLSETFRNIPKASKNCRRSVAWLYNYCIWFRTINAISSILILKWQFQPESAFKILLSTDWLVKLSQACRNVSEIFKNTNPSWKRLSVVYFQQINIRMGGECPQNRSRGAACFIEIRAREISYFSMFL